MSKTSSRLTCLVFPAVVLASLCLPQPARAVGVEPENATLVQREQAQSRFNRGRKLYDRKKYDNAIAEFRASYDIVASPNTRLMIARCLREQGQLVAAYVEFGRTAIEAEELERADRRYGRAARAASAERKALEDKLGFINVTVVNAGADTELRVAGETIKRAAWTEPVPAMPGDVSIIVETPGYRPSNEAVVLEAGKPVEVTIDAKANPIDANAATSEHGAGSVSSSGDSSHANLRPYAYVAGGIGVAGMATFAIAGLMAKSDYDDLEEECQGPCPPDRQSDVDSGRTKQTVANVGLVVGVLGLAAGTTLYLMSEDEPDGARAGITVGPGWVGVRGEM